MAVSSISFELAVLSFSELTLLELLNGDGFQRAEAAIGHVRLAPVVRAAERADSLGKPICENKSTHISCYQYINEEPPQISGS